MRGFFCNFLMYFGTQTFGNFVSFTVDYSDILKDPKYTSSSQYIHYEGIVPEQCVYASFRFILLEDVVYFL